LTWEALDVIKTHAARTICPDPRLRDDVAGGILYDKETHRGMSLTSFCARASSALWVLAAVGEHTELSSSDVISRDETCPESW